MNELLLLSLGNSELRAYLAIRHLGGHQKAVQATMDSLGTLTGLTRESLRKAIRGLESRGLLTTKRTKRNLGKLSVNSYTLEPCQPDVALKAEPCQAELASTAGIYNYNISNTSTPKYDYQYSHVVDKKYKELKVVNKWQDDGDDIGGVGLFEDEKPAVLKHKLSTDKRDPKTRGRRPQEEWTAADVAVEFSYLLSKKFPYLPGTFQTSPLRGALAKNRKQWGFTAIIELELLRLFIADDRNWRDAEQKPDLLYKRYLKMFTTHLTQAHSNLGLPSPRQLADAGTTYEKADEFVYATDGREFDNSIPGRKRLAKYEEKLKVTNG